MYKLLTAFVICAITTGAFTAYAEDAKSVEAKSAATPAKAAASGDSDKMDLKQLEDKYWAAKDSDFSVVQNRTYTKANRWFLNGSYGVLVNDSYSTGRMTNLAGGYYFNERWGVELAHETGNLTNGATVNQLISGNGVTPNYNRFLDYTSVNLLWVPMYAKMSVMEKAIWYFDLQFALGFGNLNYQNAETTLYGNGGPVNRSTTGVNFDVTANVFFSKNWAIRVDLKNTFSTEDLQRYQPQGNGGNDLGNQSQQDTRFLIGITYFH